MKLAIVTATTDPERARSCIKSWGGHPFVGVVNGRPWTPQEKPAEQIGHLTREWILSPDYLGTVPAFRIGVDYALEHLDADILCCLHDDVQILDEDWAEKVIRLFERRPACGLVGFGGAIGLGSDDLYRVPYNPMQLARIGFRSNLVDAESHGMRSLLSEQVACVDGFSLIGRAEFFAGYRYSGREDDRPWTYFEDHGVIHHCYDSLFGAYAKRLGWEVWYLPISARHLGGQTAVGDPGYGDWAKTQILDGDQGFWQQSHRRGYELFRAELPIRL